MTTFKEEMQKVTSTSSTNGVEVYIYDDCKYITKSAVELAIKCKINPKEVELRDLVLNEFNSRVKINEIERVLYNINAKTIEEVEDENFTEFKEHVDYEHDSYKYYYDNNIWSFDTLYEFIVDKISKLKYFPMDNKVKIESHGCTIWVISNDKIHDSNYIYLSNNKITWCVYKYESLGCYEAIGQMLFRKDGKWGVHDMSHCSCYGPLEDIWTATLYKDFNEIYKKISGTWLNQVIDLIDFAKEHFKGD